VVDAEELYIRSLELEPRRTQTLLDYGNFLSERGQFEYAEKLFGFIQQAETN
jgi:Tfp pilus assembly protein PilF